MTISDFNFLKDVPLSDAKNAPRMEFGHGEISNTLVKMVTNCPAPFTIGLFAKWGTGKSSLANSVKAPLLAVNIPTVIFDVWKHEGDALRRTFLKEMDRQLKESGKVVFDLDFKLSERIDNKVGQTSEGKFTFNKEKFGQIWKPLVSIIFLLGISKLLTLHYHHFDSYLKWIYGIFGLSTFSSIIFLLMQQSVKFISTETVTFSADRYEDPYQFEQEFSEILQALKHRRILIVFDNLDRVTENRVEEVLTTIKTFLEPLDAKDIHKEVIFLIPCDAKAIKKHLANVYGATDAEDFDSDEFLRKVFNTILWIPDFFPAELESFAASKLRETKVASFDDDNLAWLLTKAFRDNPRQIIQFVNILLSSYLLMKEREGEGKDFPKDFLDGNVPQLAKFLLLEQLFSKDMDGLREAKVINLDAYIGQMLSPLLATEVVRPRTNFVDFVRETTNIPIVDLQIFFTLRRAVSEKIFPGFATFIQYLEDGKSAEADDYFKEVLSKPNSTFRSDFGAAVKHIFETKTNSVSLATILDGLLRILSANDVVLSETIDADFNNAMDSRCRQALHLVSPVHVDSYLLSRRQTFRRPIFALWLDAIRQFSEKTNEQASLEFIRGAIRVITSYPSDLDQKQTVQLKRYLLDERLKNDSAIADILASAEDTQVRYIGKAYLENRIELIGLGATDVQEVLADFNWLNSIVDSVFGSIDPTRLVERLTEIQLIENARGDVKSRIQVMRGLADVLARHQRRLAKVAEPTRDALFASLMDAYNKMPVDQDRGELMEVLLTLRHFAPASRIPSIVDSIAIHAGTATVADLRHLLESLPADERAEFFKNAVIFGRIRSRVLAEEDFRAEFFKDFSPEEKLRFVEEFSAGNFATIFGFVGSLAPNDNDLRRTYLNSVLVNFDKLVAGAKEIVLVNVEAYLDIATDEVLAILAHTSCGLLTGSEVSLQKPALDLLTIIEEKLPVTLVRSITKEILDQLTNASLLIKYQPNAIEAVLLGYDQLIEEEIGVLLQFLFEELIRKGTEISQIELGFVFVDQLGIQYESRPRNFDDVLQRIKELPEGDIRSALIGGLKNMKSTRVNEKNRSFWDAVNELP